MSKKTKKLKNKEVLKEQILFFFLGFLNVKKNKICFLFY